MTQENNTRGGTLPSGDLVQAARRFCYTNEARRMFVRIIGGQVMPIGHSEADVFQLMADFAAEQLATRWTAVEDGLPDKSGGYLITDSEGFMLVSYFQVDKQRFVVVQDELATEPVAWCELPQPYVQPEKEGK